MHGYLEEWDKLKHWEIPIIENFEETNHLKHFQIALRSYIENVNTIANFNYISERKKTSGNKSESLFFRQE